MTSHVTHVNKDSSLKGHIATHTNLILPFKSALYSSHKVVLSRNSYCNTIGQSCFVRFATRTALSTPTFQTESLSFVSNIQLVTWLLLCIMKSKYSVTLLFFGSNSRYNSLLRPQPFNIIDSECRTKKPKSSRTCLIGYLGFILRKRFLIAQGQTHTHTY